MLTSVNQRKIERNIDKENNHSSLTQTLGMSNVKFWESKQERKKGMLTTRATANNLKKHPMIMIMTKN